MAIANTHLETGKLKEAGALSIRAERSPAELYVLELYGEFDLAAAELAGGELDRALESDVDEVIVDLSGLDFIDSTGLHVLWSAHARESAGANRLRFLRGSAPVERVFNLTGLDTVLPFAD
jgi:anti-sigma B factor antagonist